MAKRKEHWFRVAIRYAVSGGPTLAYPGFVAASLDAAWANKMAWAAIWLCVGWCVAIIGTYVAEPLVDAKTKHRFAATLIVGVLATAASVATWHYEQPITNAPIPQKHNLVVPPTSKPASASVATVLPATTTPPVIPTARPMSPRGHLPNIAAGGSGGIGPLGTNGGQGGAGPAAGGGGAGGMAIPLGNGAYLYAGGAGGGGAGPSGGRGGDGGSVQYGDLKATGGSGAQAHAPCTAGDNNTILGPAPCHLGSGNTFVRDADQNGNVVHTTTQAVGANAHASPDTVAIGANAAAGVAPPNVTVTGNGNIVAPSGGTNTIINGPPPPELRTLSEAQTDNADGTTTLVRTMLMNGPYAGGLLVSIRAEGLVRANIGTVRTVTTPDNTMTITGGMLQNVIEGNGFWRATLPNPSGQLQLTVIAPKGIKPVIDLKFE